MKPSRESIFRVVAQLEQAGALREDGPLSVFLSDRAGPLRLRPTQLVVRVSGDSVFVRFSRLPFVRPYVYARQALRTQAP